MKGGTKKAIIILVSIVLLLGHTLTISSEDTVKTYASAGDASGVSGLTDSYIPADSLNDG